MSGLVKDIGTITLSVIIFGNVVTTMNITGYAIVLVRAAYSLPVCLRLHFFLGCMVAEGKV